MLTDPLSGPDALTSVHEARTSLKGSKSSFRVSREGTLYTIHERRLRQSRVTAVFEDHALSFILAKGATLEELSDRLADLGGRHSERPVAITVRFGSSSQKACSKPIRGTDPGHTS